MKVLDVESLQSGIDYTKKDIERLKEQLLTIEKAVYNFSSLDDDLSGKGGDAIRSYFKDMHLSFLEYLQESLSEFDNVLTQMKESVSSFESTSTGLIKEEYLENDVKDGLDNVEKQTIELTDDANQILESIQDLVTVEKIDDSKLIEEVGTAKNKTDDVVDKLHALDDSQAEALEPVFDRVNTMKTFISELDSKFKRADVSVTSYDVNAIEDMEAYRDVTNRFFTYDEDIEERLFHDDPSYQVKNALATAQSTMENTGKKAKKKSFLSSTIDTTVQTSKGIVTGGADFVVDTAVGAYDMIAHPIQTAQSIDYMIGHPLETGKYIGNAIGESFNRDMINGDAESRAHWVTYSFGTILGTKGAGSATKGSKTASNVTNAAKQSIQNAAGKAPNVQMPYLNPFGPQHQLAPLGPVPYNVVDGVNLRDQMMMSAKRYFDWKNKKNQPHGMNNIVKGEQVLEKVNSYEQARNLALNLVGDLGPNTKSYVGTLQSSEGFGKVIGRQSSDGKVRWRLDYDPNKGPHINVEDFRNGKGVNARKYAIPFEGNERTFKSYLNQMNR